MRALLAGWSCAWPRASGESFPLASVVYTLPARTCHKTWEESDVWKSASARCFIMFPDAGSGSESILHFVQADLALLPRASRHQLHVLPLIERHDHLAVRLPPQQL